MKVALKKTMSEHYQSYKDVHSSFPYNPGTGKPVMAERFLVGVSYVGSRPAWSNQRSKLRGSSDCEQSSERSNSSN